MKRRRFMAIFARSKQALSVVLSASLIWSSSNLAQAGMAPAPSLPRSVETELTPPSSLGIVTDAFTATEDKGTKGLRDKGSPRVILIQDLHAHYGVQKNIAGILDFLSQRLSSSSLPPSLRPCVPLSFSTLPFALAVEGASGPIDSSVMALFPDQKIKQAAADYLMREGELTGAEYFAVMRGLPQALNGVEDMTYYTLHRDLFRKTLQDREQMVGILKGIQAELASLRRQIYSKELKHFQHKLDLYERGKISQFDMAEWLAGKAQTFGIAFNGRSAEDIQSMAYLLKMAIAQRVSEQQAASSEANKNAVPARRSPLACSPADLIQVEHDLALLLKVADLQATESEVRSFGPRLNQFVALAGSLLRSERPTSDVRRLISSSIDYYAMALMRNKPMVDNTLQLIGLKDEGTERPSEKSQTHSPFVPPSLSPSVAVLVAGGFHNAPITKMLRDKNISYLVITPTVDQLTEADHDLYIKRLSGQLLTDEEILAAASSISIEKSQSWLARLKSSLSPDTEGGQRERARSAGGEGEGKGLAVGIFGMMLADDFFSLTFPKIGDRADELLQKAYIRYPMASAKADAWYKKYQSRRHPAGPAFAQGSAISHLLSVISDADQPPAPLAHRSPLSSEASAKEDGEGGPAAGTDSALTLPDTYIAGAIKFLLGDKILKMWDSGKRRDYWEYRLRTELFKRYGLPEDLSLEEISQRIETAETDTKLHDLKREIEVQFAPERERWEVFKPGFLGGHTARGAEVWRTRRSGLRKIWAAAYGSAAVLFSLGTVFTAHYQGALFHDTLTTLLSSILLAVSPVLVVWAAMRIGVIVHRFHNRYNPAAALTLENPSPSPSLLRLADILSNNIPPSLAEEIVSRATQGFNINDTSRLIVFAAEALWTNLNIQTFYNLLAPNLHVEYMNDKEASEKIRANLTMQQELLESSRPPNAVQRDMVEEATRMLYNFFIQTGIRYGLEPHNFLNANIRFVDPNYLYSRVGGYGYNSSSLGTIFIAEHMRHNETLEFILHELLHQAMPPNQRLPGAFREGITQYFTKQILQKNGHKSSTNAYYGGVQAAGTFVDVIGEEDTLKLLAGNAPSSIKNVDAFFLLLDLIDGRRFLRLLLTYPNRVDVQEAILNESIYASLEDVLNDRVHSTEGSERQKYQALYEQATERYKSLETANHALLEQARLNKLTPSAPPAAGIKHLGTGFNPLALIAAFLSGKSYEDYLTLDGSTKWRDIGRDFGVAFHKFFLIFKPAKSTLPTAPPAPPVGTVPNSMGLPPGQVDQAQINERIRQIKETVRGLHKNEAATAEAEKLLSQARETLYRLQIIPTRIKRRLDNTTILVADDVPAYGYVLFDESFHTEPPAIILNARFIRTLTPIQLAFAVGHELGHIWQGDASAMVFMLTDKLKARYLEKQIEERCDLLGSLIAQRIVPQERPEHIAEIFSKCATFAPLLPQAPEGWPKEPLFDPHPSDEVRAGLIDSAKQMNETDVLNELNKPYLFPTQATPPAPPAGNRPSSIPRILFSLIAPFLVFIGMAAVAQYSAAQSDAPKDSVELAAKQDLSKTMQDLEFKGMHGSDEEAQAAILKLLDYLAGKDTVAYAGSTLQNIYSLTPNRIRIGEFAYFRQLMFKPGFDEFLHENHYFIQSILNVMLQNKPELITPSLVDKLDKWLQSPGRAYYSYESAYRMLEIIFKSRPELRVPGSAADVALQNNLRNVCWENYEIYLSPYFQKKTKEVDTKTTYEIALATYRLLLRNHLPRSPKNIQVALDRILRLREQVQKTVVFGPDAHVINILYDDPKMFSADTLERIERESLVPWDHVHSFTGAADKERALQAIVDTPGPVRIVVDAHGRPSGFDLASIGSQDPATGRSANEITVDELAEALLKRNDLGQVIIILDPCYSANEATNLYSTLIQHHPQALPFIYSHSNYDQPALGSLSDLAQTFRSVHEAGKPFYLRDFYLFQKSDDQNVSLLFAPIETALPHGTLAPDAPRPATRLVDVDKQNDGIVIERFVIDDTGRMLELPSGVTEIGQVRPSIPAGFSAPPARRSPLSSEASAKEDGEGGPAADEALTMGWVYRLGLAVGLPRRATEIILAPIVEAPIMAFVAALGWLIPSLDDWFISQHRGKDPARLRQGIRFVRYSMVATAALGAGLFLGHFINYPSFDFSNVKDWLKAAGDFSALSIPGHFYWNWDNPGAALTQDSPTTPAEELSRLREGQTVHGPDGRGRILRIADVKDLGRKVTVKLDNGEEVSYLGPTVNKLSSIPQQSADYGSLLENPSLALKDFQSFLQTIVDNPNLQGPSEVDEYVLQPVRSKITAFGNQVADIILKMPSSLQRGAVKRIFALRHSLGSGILIASYNLPDLLRFIERNPSGSFTVTDREFEQTLRQLQANIALLSPVEVFGSLKEDASPDWVFPILWQLLIHGNIKDLVWDNAQPERQEIAQKGVDIARLANLNDTTSVRQIFEAVHQQGYLQKSLAQDVQEATHHTLNEFRQRPELIDIYADEIAQVLGDSLQKREQDFPVGSPKRQSIQQWLGQLIYKKNRGIEYRISPRDLHELHAGDLTGDCTATKSNARPGVAMNFWTAPAWVANQMHFILMQYLDGQFYAKYNIALVTDDRGRVSLYIHATEISAKASTQARIFNDPEIQKRMLMSALSQITNMAKKAHIKSVYAWPVSNTPWVTTYMNRLRALKPGRLFQIPGKDRLSERLARRLSTVDDLVMGILIQGFESARESTSLQGFTEIPISPKVIPMSNAPAAPAAPPAGGKNPLSNLWNETTGSEETTVALMLVIPASMVAAYIWGGGWQGAAVAGTVWLAIGVLFRTAESIESLAALSPVAGQGRTQARDARRVRLEHSDSRGDSEASAALTQEEPVFKSPWASALHDFVAKLYVGLWWLLEPRGPILSGRWLTSSAASAPPAPFAHRSLGEGGPAAGLATPHTPQTGAVGLPLTIPGASVIVGAIALAAAIHYGSIALGILSVFALSYGILRLTGFISRNQDVSDDGMFTNDPLDSLEVGFQEQVESLRGKTLAQLADISIAVGDMDSYGNINALFSKLMIGTLAAIHSPNLLYNARRQSLFRESRSVLRTLCRGYGLQIYRYFGGDEFVVERARHPGQERTAPSFVGLMRRVVREFSQYFHDRYAMVRIESPEQEKHIFLSQSQIRALSKVPGVEVIVRHNNGYNLLLNRDGLDGPALENILGNIRAIVHRMKRTASYNALWLSYEYKSIETPVGPFNETRGMFTTSVGVVPSMKEVVEYLASVPGQSLKDWTTPSPENKEPVLRDDRLTEILFWARAIANDLERRAKQEQPVPKNRIFAPKPGSSLGQYLFKPITSEKILEARKTLAQGTPSLDREAGLTEWQTFEELNSKMPALTLYTVGSYLGRKFENRAFHMGQNQTGGLEAAGNQMIRAFARSVSESARSNQSEVYISRKAPDNFYALSQTPLDVQEKSLRDLFKAALQEQAPVDAGLAQLRPHFLIYQVTDEQLAQVKRQLRWMMFVRLLQFRWDDRRLLAEVLGTLRNKQEAMGVLTAVNPQTLINNGLVEVIPSDQPDTTIFRFDPKKAAELLTAFWNAEEERMDIGLANLRWEPLDGDRRWPGNARYGMPNQVQIDDMVSQVKEALPAGKSTDQIRTDINAMHDALNKLDRAVMVARSNSDPRLRVKEGLRKQSLVDSERQRHLDEIGRNPIHYGVALLRMSHLKEKRTIPLNSVLVEKLLNIVAPSPLAWGDFDKDFDGLSEIKHWIDETRKNLSLIEKQILPARDRTSAETNELEPHVPPIDPHRRAQPTPPPPDAADTALFPKFTPDQQKYIAAMLMMCERPEPRLAEALLILEAPTFQSLAIIFRSLNIIFTNDLVERCRKVRARNVYKWGLQRNRLRDAIGMSAAIDIEKIEDIAREEQKMPDSKSMQQMQQIRDNAIKRAWIFFDDDNPSRVYKTVDATFENIDKSSPAPTPPPAATPALQMHDAHPETNEQAKAELWNQIAKHFNFTHNTKNAEDVQQMLATTNEAWMFERIQEMADRGIFDGHILHRFGFQRDSEGRWDLIPTAEYTKRADSPLLKTSASAPRSDPALVQSMRQRIVVRPLHGIQEKIGPANEELDKIFADVSRRELTIEELELFEYFTLGPGRKDEIVYEVGTELGDANWSAAEGGSVVNFGGPASYDLGIRDTFQMMKHEISHAMDGRRELTGVAPEIKGYTHKELNHAFVFLEWRANLWALDGDLDKAFESTFLANESAVEYALKLFPPGTSTEAIYRTLWRLTNEIDRPLFVSKQEDIALVAKYLEKTNTLIQTPERADEQKTSKENKPSLPHTMPMVPVMAGLVFGAVIGGYVGLAVAAAGLAYFLYRWGGSIWQLGRTTHFNVDSKALMATVSTAARRVAEVNGTPASADQIDRDDNTLSRLWITLHLSMALKTRTHQFLNEQREFLLSA